MNGIFTIERLVCHCSSTDESMKCGGPGWGMHPWKLKIKLYFLYYLFIIHKNTEITSKATWQIHFICYIIRTWSEADQNVKLIRNKIYILPVIMSNRIKHLRQSAKFSKLVTTILLIDVRNYYVVESWSCRD